LQQQLQALMDTLNMTQPHYIRCVKPNMLNKPGRFENINVMQQLRCGVSSLLHLAFHLIHLLQFVVLGPIDQFNMDDR
jgi:hypothetical protein